MSSYPLDIRYPRCWYGHSCNGLNEILKSYVIITVPWHNHTVEVMSMSGISSKGIVPVGGFAGDGDDVVESLPCVKILVFGGRCRHSIRKKKRSREEGDE